MCIGEDESSPTGLDCEGWDCMTQPMTVLCFYVYARFTNVLVIRIFFTQHTPTPHPEPIYPKPQKRA
jgi:hypothetical protein